MAGKFSRLNKVVDGNFFSVIQAAFITTGEETAPLVE